jgi:Taurine catabolism dioxygenase TauD, TfdA family
MAVYNEMLARRPDLVEVLRQPFAWDRNDEQSPGEDPFFNLPVIFDFDGSPQIFQPGDIQLLNNAKILHAREAYVDHAGSAERRHLLRLWLTAHAFASVEDALRGGIPARRDS